MEPRKQSERDAGEVTTLQGAADASHWAFITDWKVEPQYNDRPVMSGKVAPSTAPRSAQRSTARRTHQAMFKKWSQSRHE